MAGEPGFLVFWAEAEVNLKNTVRPPICPPYFNNQKTKNPADSGGFFVLFGGPWGS